MRRLESLIKRVFHHLAILYLVGVLLEHLFSLPLNAIIGMRFFVAIPVLTLLSLLLLLIVHCMQQPRVALWVLLIPFGLHLLMILSIGFDLDIYPAWFAEPQYMVNLLIIMLIGMSFMLYDDWFRVIVSIGAFVGFISAAMFNVVMLDALKHDQITLEQGNHAGLFITHFMIMLLAASIAIDLLIRCVGKHTVGRKFESRFTRVTIDAMFAIPLLLMLTMLISVEFLSSTFNLELYLTTAVLTMGPFLAGIMVFMEQRLWYQELTTNEETLNQEKQRLLSLARQQRSELNLRKEVAQITSHHLRGPASAMLKLSEELKKDEVSKAEVDFYHQELLKNAQQNMDTIDDLAFLFNSLRRADFARQVVDVQRLFRDEFDRLRLKFQAVARIQMDLDFASINYSNDHLRGLVGIFLSNAFQFRHPDRHLVVIVRYTKTVDHALIEIEDNGIGFNSEQEGAKVFQYGYKLDQATENRGTGLFLAKGLLDLRGDDVEIHSNPNEGTVVTLKLRNT